MLNEGQKASVLRLAMTMDKIHVGDYSRAKAVEADQEIVEDEVFH